MENVARIIITIFFIGLIALAIIFFGVFGLVPLEKVGKIGKGGPQETGTEYTNTENNTNGQSQNTDNNGSAINTPQTPITQNPGGSQTNPQPGKTGGDIEQVNPVTPTPSTPEPYVPPPKKEVRLDVPPGSPNAPEQSAPLTLSQIPKDAAHLIVRGNSFSPPSFLAKKGKEITIALQSEDGRTHIFMFKDPSLSAIAVGVGPREIRAITFTPIQTGEFWFFCNVPGHESSGEYGKMVVVE